MEGRGVVLGLAVLLGGEVDVGRVGVGRRVGVGLPGDVPPIVGVSTLLPSQ